MGINRKIFGGALILYKNDIQLDLEFLEYNPETALILYKNDIQQDVVFTDIRTIKDLR